MRRCLTCGLLVVAGCVGDSTVLPGPDATADQSTPPVDASDAASASDADAGAGDMDCGAISTVPWPDGGCDGAIYCPLSNQCVSDGGCSQYPEQCALKSDCPGSLLCCANGTLTPGCPASGTLGSGTICQSICPNGTYALCTKDGDCLGLHCRAVFVASVALTVGVCLP